ncbi:MAG: hypothetical protein ACRD1K_20840 [Acidimicrobiales bacterium]
MSRRLSQSAVAAGAIGRVRFSLAVAVAALPGGGRLVSFGAPFLAALGLPAALPRARVRREAIAAALAARAAPG